MGPRKTKLLDVVRSSAGNSAADTIRQIIASNFTKPRQGGGSHRLLLFGAEVTKITADKAEWTAASAVRSSAVHPAGTDPRGQ
jgi:hypothetical protein